MLVILITVIIQSDKDNDADIIDIIIIIWHIKNILVIVWLLTSFHAREYIEKLWIGEVMNRG